MGVVLQDFGRYLINIFWDTVFHVYATTLTGWNRSEVSEGEAALPDQRDTVVVMNLLIS